MPYTYNQHFCHRWRFHVKQPDCQAARPKAKILHWNWKIRQNQTFSDVSSAFYRIEYDNNYWTGIGEEISSELMNIIFSII